MLGVGGNQTWGPLGKFLAFVNPAAWPQPDNHPRHAGGPNRASLPDALFLGKLDLVGRLLVGSRHRPPVAIPAGFFRSELVGLPRCQPAPDRRRRELVGVRFQARTL